MYIYRKKIKNETLIDFKNTRSGKTNDLKRVRVYDEIFFRIY